MLKPSWVPVIAMCRLNGRRFTNSVLACGRYINATFKINNFTALSPTLSDIVYSVIPPTETPASRNSTVIPDISSVSMQNNHWQFFHIWVYLLYKFSCFRVVNSPLWTFLIGGDNVLAAGYSSTVTFHFSGSVTAASWLSLKLNASFFILPLDMHVKSRSYPTVGVQQIVFELLTWAQHIIRNMTWKEFVRATRPKCFCAGPKTVVLVSFPY